MGASFAVNDEVGWGDDQLASYFFQQEQQKLKKKFSSIIDAYTMASGAASDMVLAPKDSGAYQEAKNIFDEAIAYIKIFKGR